jgi:hypothetical protein
MAMFSIRTAAVIAALAMTVFAYGDDGSVAATSARRGAHGVFALSEALGERIPTADAVRPVRHDSAKPKRMIGWCVDGDGGDNPNVASYVIDAFGTQWQDYCQNSNLQVEDTCGYAGSMIHYSHTCTCVSEWINVPGWGSRYAGKCQ